MTVESDDDRAVFLDTDEFGAAAVYTPAATGLASDPIAGAFNDPHLAAQFGNVEISASTPIFTCRAVDLPAAAAGGDAGDTLAVGAVTYRVVDLQPDGAGMTTLTLGRA